MHPLKLGKPLCQLNGHFLFKGEKWSKMCQSLLEYSTSLTLNMINVPLWDTVI